MALVAAGLLNKQVGGELNISDHGKGTPRSGDAQDEGRLSRRLSDNGRQTPTPTCAEGLTLPATGRSPLLLSFIHAKLESQVDPLLFPKPI